MREIIRKRLIEEIQASKLTTVQIGEKLGIDPSNITQYKNTNKLPSLETFAKLCKIIGADANYILGITDN